MCTSASLADIKGSLYLDEIVVESTPSFHTIMPSPRQSEVDVLIIGAGPAGIMCANALGHAGVNIKIVDKRYALAVTLVRIYRCVT